MEQAADQSHDKQGELRPLPGGFKLLSGTNTLASARVCVRVRACLVCGWERVVVDRAGVTMRAVWGPRRSLPPPIALP